jgi:hypothetical protein
MKQAITEFDLFYISYDEPQKEEYWAKIQELAPWAKRVDGVKGFDSAHKACAEQSETERFITIDGDNIVYPEFFDLQIEIPEKLHDKTLSWAGRNVINGLCYGNGGAKLWTKEFVLNMRTHENATNDAEKVDFCWDDKYVQLNGVYTDTCPNGSPFQAFRAGFREGVKMTLDRGVKAGEGVINKYLHEKNYRRLLIWATIGADVENGDWAIYGTRLGIYMANIDKTFDISQISDYEWFKKYWDDHIIWRFADFPEIECTHWCPRTKLRWNNNELRKESAELIIPLNRELGMTIANFNEEQSRFFKSVYEPPKRTMNPLATEIEVDQ